MLQITGARSRRIARRSTLLVVAASLTLAWTAGAAGAQTGKISRTPFPIELQEGASQVVEVKLSQPLISPGPDEAYLTITFVSEDPDRLTVSPASVTWTFTEWWQARTVTVEALVDGVHDATDSVTVAADVVTNAPYYADAPASIEVGIQDLDPVATTSSAPAASTSTTSTAAPVAAGAEGGRDDGAAGGAPGRQASAPVGELAFTGARRTSPTLALVGAVSVLSGAMMLRTSRRRRTT